MLISVNISIYAVTSFIATIANIAFALFVLLKNPSSRINQMWFFTILCVAYWGGAEMILRLVNDARIIERTVQYGGLGFILLPVFFLHFAAAFTEKLPSSKKLLVPMYGSCILFCILQLIGKVTKPVGLPWGYTFTPASFYPVYILWLEINFLTGVYWCWKKFHSALSRRERIQTLLILFAVSIPLGIGSFTDAFLPLFGIETYRLAVVTTTVTVALVSIGVVRFQLMSLTPESTAHVILETMGDLVAVADVNGFIRFTNSAFRSSIGMAQSITRVEHFLSDESLHDTQHVASTFQRTETVYKRHDGSQFPVLLSVSKIVDHDEHVGTIYLASDITEKKKMEQQFLRMQRLESIGTMASGIAHDLNNILSPILVGIGKIRHSQEGTTSHWKSILEVMDRSSKRGVALVKQILMFARGTVSDESIIDLRYLFYEVKKIIQETFPKNIHIDVQAEYDVLPVTGNSVQLHQVLLNLCVNARDAMPAGGTLSLRAENVTDINILKEKHPEVQRQQRYICLSVSDTGTGIPEDILRKIFDPFFTTKEQGKGTGLGLSTVATIVNNHKGFIDVHSSVGSGTTFSIFLPSSPATGESEEPQTVKNIPFGNGELILLADDEASIVEITKETLEAHHYRVLTAMNGHEAVELFTQHRNSIRMVIMDIGMPEMDGPTAIKAIQLSQPKTKIIAVSAQSTTETDLEIVKKNVAAFLPKPFTAYALLNCISEVLQRT